MYKVLKKYRLERGFKTSEVAQAIGVDQSLISKFETGVRKPTEQQIIQLADLYKIDEKQLLTLWLKTKILEDIQQYNFAPEAIKLVQEEIATYHKSIPKHSASLQEKLDKIDVLLAQLQVLRQFDSYRVREALELEYTFESNRIEGNTLTLQETDFVINEGLTVSGKSMREHLEAINHNEAIEYIKELIEKDTILNEREVLTLHNLVLRGIDSKYAGKYRNVEVMIRGSQHVPPQPFLVPKQMEDYFEWYVLNKSKLHPVILAAEMHERLVTIHPFIDGNGRTSRLVMNLILLSHGLVIANIKGDTQSRMNYYKAIEKARVSSTKEEYHHFICDVEIECLERYLSILS